MVSDFRQYLDLPSFPLSGSVFSPPLPGPVWLPPAIVHIRWGNIPQPLVIALVIVVVDKLSTYLVRMAKFEWD